MNRTVYLNGTMWRVRVTARNNERRLASLIITATQGTDRWAVGFAMRCGQIVQF